MVHRLGYYGKCALSDEIPFRAEGMPFTLVDYGCADGGTSREIIKKCIGQYFICAVIKNRLFRLMLHNCFCFLLRLFESNNLFIPH